MTVITQQPARHAVAAPRASAISVGFSQAISAASAANLRVYSAQRGGKLAGSISGGGTATLVFTPSQAFVAGDALSVSLPASLVSTGGTALARQVYQFAAATGGSGRGFFGDTTVVGNTGNRDQVLGDLDNDGDLDLITTGALYGCRVYTNNGSGRYQFYDAFVAAQTPSGVALADVDGDGDLDVLVGDYDNGLVSVCINDGMAHFIGSVTGAQNAPVGRRPVSVAAGDVDGDGDLDFVTANSLDSTATVRYNNGNLPLLYTSASTVAVGAGPTAVALADVDNDGDLDLLTSNAGTGSSPVGTVTLCRNSGTGAFGAPTSFVVGLQPSELALADVDNDGDLDLLTANAGAASVSRLLNNGSGTFASLATIALPAGSAPTGLRTGDMDADGDLDILVAQGTGGRVFTLLNTAGSFAVQARPLRLNGAGTTNPVQSVGVTLGDVDGDFDLDLITSDEHGKVLQSLNLGSLPPLPAPVITGLSPGSGPVGASVIIIGTALTDVAGVFFSGVPAPAFVLNGAGTGLTVAVPVGATSGVVTVVTEEAGTATSPGSFAVTIPIPVLVTGITPPRNQPNAARNTNITATFTVSVTAATAGNLRVAGNLLRGRRPGTLAGGGTTTLTFDPTQDFAPGEQVSVTLPGTLLAADGNRVSRQVVQFTAATGGTGQMNFAAPTVLNTTRQVGQATLADVDNDGDLDVLMPSNYGGSSSIGKFTNNGSGSFTETNITTTAGSIGSLTVADVDNDGDLDVLATAVGSAIAVLLNDGSGNFSSGPTVVAPYNYGFGQIFAADVDADGDQDLLVLSVQNNAVQTYLNNGAGGFTPGTALSIARYTISSLAVGDLDGDGDLDLALTGSDYYKLLNVVDVQLNDGTGQFVHLADFATGPVPTLLALGDLDGDGDLDVACQMGNTYNESTGIALNNGNGTFTNGGNIALTNVGRTVLADADADGDLDIVATNAIGVNNGQGVFATVLPLNTAPYYPANVAVGDLDGDGDLDLVIPQNSTRLVVWRNLPLPVPTITAVLPGSGPVGSSVVLAGTNLLGARTVLFNGVAATGFVVNSITEVMATVPAGATTGVVTLTTAAGTATSATPFTVTLPIAVLAVSPARNVPNAPRATAVSATFAQPIGAGSTAGFRVSGARLRGLRPGTLSGAGSSVLTFTPAQPFAPGEEVSVSLTASLAGAGGGNVVRHVFQFTAAAGGTGTGVFTSVSPTPTYDRAQALVAGDIDNDGDLDVISSDGSIRLNNGSGTFSAPAGVALAGSSDELALADLNNDGRLDLLASSGNVRINTGTGTFTNKPNFYTRTAYGGGLATGDFDGDGNIDVAAAGYSNDSVYVSFNDGTGSFTRHRALPASIQCSDVVAGDLDNDGDLDLISAQANSSQPLTIYLNNGNGVFGRARSLAATNYLSRVVLGDLDGDGDLDLITNAGDVRFNDGAGNFSGSQSTIGGQKLVLGDLDADGDLDLVVSTNLVTTWSTNVRLNDGHGVFSTVAGIGFTDAVAALALADFDGDGDLDAVAGFGSRSGLQLSLNERVAPPSIASFSPASALPGATVVLTGTDLIGVTAVRFNGTTAPGFVVNSATQITVTVPAGATTGLIQVTNPRGSASSPTAFVVLRPITVLSTSPARNAVAPLAAPVSVSFSQAIPTNSPATLAVFSAKRGGRLTGTRTGAGTSTLTLAPAQPFQPGEIIQVSVPPLTDAGQATRVAKQVYQFRADVGGTGRGYLSSPATAPLDSLVLGTLLGDVTGDGSPDLLVRQEFGVEVRRNNGAGGFSYLGRIEMPLSTTRNGNNMALGDVDGDGDLDLVAISFSTDVVSIRLNNGTGTFSGLQNLPVDSNPLSLALADMDADGDLDVVVASQGVTGSHTSVRFNDGAGSFSGSGSSLLVAQSNTTTSNIVVGDIDGDGDADAIGVNGGFAFVQLNDGLGQLTTTSTPIALSLDSGYIELADIDGDGDLDVVASCYPFTAGQPLLVKVGRNDGAGNFALTSFPVAPDATGIALGDVDADQDLDLVVLGSFGNPGQLWLNNGQGMFNYLVDLDLGTSATFPVLGDVDADGDLDLLYSHYYTNDYSVRLNGPTPPPLISSFSPASGPEGTVVVITGSGFLGTTAVKFNGAAAPGFLVNSPTQITVRVPTLATTGLISVTTPVATATSATAFTVILRFAPTILTPARNAVAVSRSAAVGITFSEPVTTATAGNLRVFGNQVRGRRPGVVTGGGTASLSFDPDQDFAPGELISVSLPATLQSGTGSIVRKQVYQFRAATGGAGGGGLQAGIDVRLGPAALALGLGDLDNDGDLDLLTSSFANGVSMMVPQLNSGQGRFTAGTAFNTPYGTEVSELELADVDGDGDLDAVARHTVSLISISLNDGRAGFSQHVFTGLQANALAMGDVDADGDLDLVTVSSTGNSVAVALNDGAGNFAQLTMVSAPGAVALVLGDVDGDGDLDVATSTSTNNLQLYLNDGGGLLAASATLALPANTQALTLALADLDADGDLDLAVGYNDTGYNGWLTTFANNGSGSFAASGQQVALDGGVQKLQLGDLDHDGDLDVVAATGPRDNLSVRLNNGQGRFSGSFSVPVRATVHQLALGDLDGDGDLDAATTQESVGTGYADIRLNNGQILATNLPTAGSIKVYPNPALGRFTVVVPQELRPATPTPLRLYNVLGQLVLEQSWQPAGGEQTVEVAHLPPGLYSLRLVLRDGPATFKVVLR